jgi:hypothetical protein
VTTPKRAEGTGYPRWPRRHATKLLNSAPADARTAAGECDADGSRGGRHEVEAAQREKCSRAPLRGVDEVEVFAVLERAPAAVSGDKGLVDAGQEHGRAAATSK